MHCRDNKWYRDRIARTRQAIERYEDAIEALSSGAQTYHLDTGQTRQIVTRAQLSQLKNTLQYLENRLSTLEARVCGATVIGRPGF